MISASAIPSPERRGPGSSEMCSICGFPQTPGHWSDAGAADAHQRVRSRFLRLTALNAALSLRGLTAYDDALTPGIQIADRMGNTIVASDLRDVWVAAEKLSGAVIDPLVPVISPRHGES